MKKTNDESAAVQTRCDNKLESLAQDKKEMILELATHTRQIDMVEILKGHGIEVSVPTLSRFVRRYRERRVLEDGEDMKDAVTALAKRNGGEDLRRGTLEAARQKLYEQVVNSNDPETARGAYEAMLKEETKLKELELEGRKAAALEEGVRLQRLRIEVMAAAAQKGIENGRKRTQRSQNGMAVVVEAGPVIAGELPGPSEREFAEKDFTEGKKCNEEREEIARLWRQMGEVLNRGGRPEEKLLEARAVWEEGRGRLELEETGAFGRNGS